MFSTSDTIVAIATPAGRGGIGVVRVSGQQAQAIARAITTHDGEFAPRHATLTKVKLSTTEETGDTGAKPESPSDRVVFPDRPSPVRQEGCPSVSSVSSAVKQPRASSAIDHAIVTFFEAPHSYTGEDVVELSAHGSPAVLRAIVAAAASCGARLAEPGEFTLRAFLNGRMDLLQAEAVADLVDAVTPLQARVAFDQLEGTLTGRIAAIDAALFDLAARLEASVDFPDEGYQFVAPADVVEELIRVEAQLAALAADARIGRIVREGAQVSVVGRPNVGKSSIFNALVGVARAIVTEVPGTTRDLVTETVDLEGLKITLVDTAGLRDTADRVEAIGVDRARRALDVSDVILVVIDASQPLQAYDQKLMAATPVDRRLVVVNKCDLAPAWPIGRIAMASSPVMAVSALTGEGIAQLRGAIVRRLDRDNVREQPAITNVRHAALVDRARDSVGRAIAAIRGASEALPEEFVLADLQEARGALEEIVGKRAPEELLAHIFSRFCIGK